MSKSPSPQGTPWMPVTAGTLSIIAGVIQVLVGLAIIGLGAELAERRGLEGLGVIGLPFLILGIVAIIGGVFSAVLRAWPMALIGAIAGAVMPIVALLRDAVARTSGMRAGTVVFLIVILICGVAAIVLTVAGRQDFK